VPRRKPPAPTTEGIPADPARFEEAIEKFRDRVPMKRGEWEKLEEGQKEHAFFVSEVSLAELVNEAYEAVGKALEEGTGLAEFKATAGASLIEHWGGEKPGRLETILRTNVMTAYSGGRHAVMSAPAMKKARPFRRFDGIDDDRQTEICASLDGKVYAADDPIWLSRTPPLHFNCRSILTPLSETEAAEEDVEDELPPSAPQAGFGSPPALDGPDWEPDVTKYPEEIQAELAARLKKGGG
jgi:SPP1 gp7 family putative phage head morphogenesis protein